MKHDLMVMENVTFGRNITRQYDLKGALHARYTSAVDGSGDVLLDQNFVDDMNASPLYVSRKAKRILQRAVWNDTTFLNVIFLFIYFRDGFLIIFPNFLSFLTLRNKLSPDAKVEMVAVLVFALQKVVQLCTCQSPNLFDIILPFWTH